mmetsp:Transcript_21115/g.69687  ORF Transcript_21115/g.69687 Transcript_21115/m.69687 type:complete len:297 (-) Transcript_21115:2941-3831(-)
MPLGLGARRRRGAAQYLSKAVVLKLRSASYRVSHNKQDLCAARRGARFLVPLHATPTPHSCAQSRHVRQTVCHRAACSGVCRCRVPDDWTPCQPWSCCAQLHSELSVSPLTHPRTHKSSLTREPKANPHPPERPPHTSSAGGEWVPTTQQSPPLPHTALVQVSRGPSAWCGSRPPVVGAPPPRDLARPPGGPLGSAPSAGWGGPAPRRGRTRSKSFARTPAARPARETRRSTSAAGDPWCGKARCTLRGRPRSSCRRLPASTAARTAPTSPTAAAAPNSPPLARPRWASPAGATAA